MINSALNRLPHDAAVTPRHGTRSRFEKHKDLLAGFASGDISYPSFAARVRRREKGQPEKSDWQIALDDEVLLEDDPDTFFIK